MHKLSRERFDYLIENINKLLDETESYWGEVFRKAAEAKALAEEEVELKQVA